jgi:hypothetical protein
MELSLGTLDTTVSQMGTLFAGRHSGAIPSAQHAAVQVMSALGRGIAWLVLAVFWDYVMAQLGASSGHLHMPNLSRHLLDQKTARVFCNSADPTW